MQAIKDIYQMLSVHDSAVSEIDPVGKYRKLILKKADQSVEILADTELSKKKRTATVKTVYLTRGTIEKWRQLNRTVILGSLNNFVRSPLHNQSVSQQGQPSNSQFGKNQDSSFASQEQDSQQKRRSHDEVEGQINVWDYMAEMDAQEAENGAQAEALRQFQNAWNELREAERAWQEQVEKMRHDGPFRAEGGPEQAGCHPGGNVLQCRRIKQRRDAMIIGQFCDTYPPSVDGVGRVTEAYCTNLTAMGHETYYIAPKSPGVPAPDGYHVVLSMSMRAPGELFRVGLPKLDFSYRRELGEIPFDIVHAQSPFLAGSEAARIAKKLSIPLVSTFHSKYYDDALAKTHSKTLARTVTNRLVRFYNDCDAVWTVNNATAAVLESYGYRGHILVMENGTDPQPLDPEGQRRLNSLVTFKNGVPVLLFVGQHNWKKNLHGILGACALLKRSGQPFQLVTAGDGPDYQAIRAEAKELGIDSQVTFLGFVTDKPMLMALYSRADLLVFPSLYDNAPMVLREAAVMGTPGLLVKGSCSAEGVSDGYNGFISEDETAEAIAKTIRRALPMTAKVGANAKQTIPIAWPVIMERVVAEYRRLIDLKNPEV